MKISLGKIKFKFKLKPKYHKKIIRVFKFTFWFLLGAIICLLLIASFGFLAYQKIYENRIFNGVSVDNVDFSGKSEKNVKDYFDTKNKIIGKASFSLVSDYQNATISAKDIGYGYNSTLLAKQAYSLGRSSSPISNISIMLQAYFVGVNLSPSYTYDKASLENSISPILQKINKDPVEALFKFENGKVTAFRLSNNGQAIDMDLLNKRLSQKTLAVISSSDGGQTIIVPIPIKIIPPKVSTEEVNNFGIKELIGEGHSLFYHSIPSRIFNINLAASRVNGILVAPGETFSFDKALGDVSAFTGYKQAYVIQNGKTVLGDGGGVCQVSTTFFRALLNGGLPIIERHAHAYRVGYYEEDSPPGIDATVFVPTVDLKFKNDTGNYILIQSQIDLDNLSLSYYLYGVKDGRTVSMTTPVVSNVTPAPPDLYQDDPTLPSGTIKQTDFAAAGAHVSFSRTVTKNGKEIIADTFVSNYQPWQAIYLRGTGQ